jgi:glutamine synthetase
MSDSMQEFLRGHGIHEVECVITDMTGIARGKILPKDLFLGADHMRLPKSVLLNTVNGEQPNNAPYVGSTDPDMVCVPDPATMRVVPWAAESVALVIHDCQNFDGTPVELAPRNVLRRVLARYAERGWRPVVAPEMEFYLVARNANPHEPLSPPMGRSGMTELGRQSYSIDAVNDFDPFFLELSAFCKAHELGVETLIHEAGAGQMEINFAHGDALELADRAFLFKRAVREGPAPRHLRHLHGQADGDRAGQRDACTPERGGRCDRRQHLFQSGRQRERPVSQLRRRAGEVRAAGAGDVRAARELVPAAVALPVGADQRALGL